ncbi:MAG: DUF1697 domain-containing protein [Chloroflexota bacterium]
MSDSAVLPAHVALLRGVNLGGKNKLPMKELVAMFADAGCADVRSYIQSGNVVFRASESLAAQVPALVTATIAERFGFRVPIVLRTADELREVSEDNPFLAVGADPSALHVVFLADDPGPERTAALDPQRSPGDAFALRGRDIYLHCPHGFGRSKLTTDYFDRKLATVSTVRNWNTVLRLLALAQG